MSKATIDQSLAFLEKKDYVFKDKQGYVHVLDPLIKSVLSGLCMLRNKHKNSIVVRIDWIPAFAGMTFIFAGMTSGFAG